MAAGPEALRLIGGSDDDELIRSRAYDGLAGARRLERVRERREDSARVVRHVTGTEAERDCDAARHAQATYGAERVAIVEFDVHHGNGTQHIFSDVDHHVRLDARDAALSRTGEMGERGGHDQIVNAPLRADDRGEAFREAMEVAILPRIADLAPDLIVISAGFDAHRRDPLGNLNLIEPDYFWVTWSPMEIAQRRCDGRIVSELEGGYDLDARARSAAAHMLALMER
jgi:acetoin utilization deacetylase AcuC-like enzyme